METKASRVRGAFSGVWKENRMMRGNLRKGMALLLVATLFGMAACGGQEAPQQGNAVGEQTPTEGVTPEGDGQDTQGENVSDLQETTDDNEGATDEAESGDKTGGVTTVVLSDSGITVDGTGCDVRADRVKIEEAGTYEISGTLSNGYIYVNVDNESEVHLILKGVKVHNETSAAFFSKKAAKVTVTLAEGTENVFSDGAAYVFEPNEDEPDATFYAKHDLVIEGEGTLKVTANYGDAIKGKDSLYINGGVIEVDAVDDGITGRDLLQINGGVITVNSESDAIKSSNDVDPALGNIEINGGVLTLTGDGDDIQAEKRVIINGGTLALSAGEDGIQSGSGTELNGGTVTTVK